MPQVHWSTPFVVGLLTGIDLVLWFTGPRWLFACVAVTLWLTLVVWGMAE